MDYTDEMLRCLRKLSERRLDELQKKMEVEFAGSEVSEYLTRLICNVKERG